MRLSVSVHQKGSVENASREAAHPGVPLTANPKGPQGCGVWTRPSLAAHLGPGHPSHPGPVSWRSRAPGLLPPLQKTIRIGQVAKLSGEKALCREEGSRKSRVGSQAACTAPKHRARPERASWAI